MEASDTNGARRMHEQGVQRRNLRILALTLRFRLMAYERREYTFSTDERRSGVMSDSPWKRATRMVRDGCMNQGVQGRNLRILALTLRFRLKAYERREYTFSTDEH